MISGPCWIEQFEDQQGPECERQKLRRIHEALCHRGGVIPFDAFEQ